MDQTSSIPPNTGGGYAGGTIALHPELFSSPKFIAKHDASHTYFCILMIIVLLILSLLFPRSMGASGMTYKVREILIILATVSFSWSLLKTLKLWRFPMPVKMMIFLTGGTVLIGLTTGILLYHGVEERKDKELKARPYMQTQNLMKK